MTNETKGQFLVTHNKCPVCGNTEQLGQQAVDKLTEDGVLAPAFNYVGVTLQVPLIDPAHPPVILASTFTIMVLLMSLDACANPDCGAVYCKRFDVVGQPAQVAPLPPNQQIVNRQQHRHSN